LQKGNHIGGIFRGRPYCFSVSFLHKMSPLIINTLFRYGLLCLLFAYSAIFIQNFFR
jgi:hypothetical protein